MMIFSAFYLTWEMHVLSLVNCALLCTMFGAAVVLHRRMMERMNDVITEVRLAKAYADQAAMISQRTDTRLADGTAKADNPAVVVVGDKIKQKIEELASTLPAKVAEEVRAQVQGDSGHMTLPCVNIEADTVNVTPAPVTDTIPKPPPAATTRQFAKPPE